MNILVIGNDHHLNESKAKFGKIHSYQVAGGHQAAEKFFGGSDVIFDFVIDKFPDQMEVYRDHPKVVAFLNTPKTSLINLLANFAGKIHCTLFGFNGLPTFLTREILEVAMLNQNTADTLRVYCEKLQTKYLAVDDRVGMVTPRVIFMIINEAYFTLEEGTASKEDIDVGMKLGTNYPYGPFEWGERIGIDHICELLDAVYKDTGNERYRICALLKREYLQRLTTQRSLT